MFMTATLTSGSTTADPIARSGQTAPKIEAQIVHGTYLKGEEGLPPAREQGYVLPAGAFFTVRDGKVARISNHYDLQECLAQVSADEAGRQLTNSRIRPAGRVLGFSPLFGTVIFAGDRRQASLT